MTTDLEVFLFFFLRNQTQRLGIYWKIENPKYKVLVNIKNSQGGDVRWYVFHPCLKHITIFGFFS